MRRLVSRGKIPKEIGQNLSILHYTKLKSKQKIIASPFKIKILENNLNPIGKDLQNIFEQNNFTNQTLHTIDKQLIRIENIV